MPVYLFFIQLARSHSLYFTEV